LRVQFANARKPPIQRCIATRHEAFSIIVFNGGEEPFYH
jgi:hypothetical protein